MTEFADVVRRRRMTRSFDGRPIPADVLDGLFDLASRSPSAGKSQGWHFVVLNGEQTSRFWKITLPVERRASFRWQGLLRAPTLVLPLADATAYTARYSEPDKIASGLGESPDAWPVPYWTVDVSMAMMTLLHGAEAAGLGALLFGVFRGEAALRSALGIPDGLQLLGAIALGYSDGSVTGDGRSATRPRRPVEQIVHRGRW